MSVRYPAPNMPRKGEIPLKQYVQMESAKHGITPIAFYHRMKKGHAPWPKRRIVNARVVFVKNGGAS